MDLEVEYRNIEGFPRYQAGSDGTIRSNYTTGRYARNKIGPWQILKPSLSNNGYLALVLYRDNKRFSRTCHRVILETFVGKAPPGMECRHLNGIRTDNRLENLTWGTRRENVTDRIHHGKRCGCPGESHPCSKLKNEDVIEIRKLRKEGLSQRKVARMFKISQSTVGRIALGETWKHLLESE